MVLVVLFIWAYFREWKMSVGAIVALIHDVVITIGVYALSGFEVTPATVTGILTILGFSLYDTVVVFDKVRENTRNLRQSKQTYAQLANLAVNQTLVRSINTSIVALLPVGAILYVGVATLGTGALKDLALVPVRGHGGRRLLLDLHRDAAGRAPEVAARRRSPSRTPAPRRVPGAASTATPTCPCSPTTCRCGTGTRTSTRDDDARGGRGRRRPRCRRRRVGPRPPAPAASYPGRRQPLGDSGAVEARPAQAAAAVQARQVSRR